MPQGSPIVSVVLPTYRRPHMIAAAIASVRSQTWGDWELLVVDDNDPATPERRATEEAVRAYAVDARVRYLGHERNRGACAARNTGIAAARGTFVAFLDDDDAWAPDKLERQVRCFEQSPADTALVYAGFRRVYPDGQARDVHPDGSAHRLPRLLQENAIGTTSLVMCRREALTAVGGFDEELPSMQDFDLFLRLGLRYPFAFVPAILAEHRRHRGPRISSDAERVVRAHDLFMRKHAALFAAWPGAHAHRWRAHAVAMARFGRARDARAAYWRAWRLRPADTGSLAAAILAWPPVLGFARTLRRSLNRLRSPRPAAAARSAGRA